MYWRCEGDDLVQIGRYDRYDIAKDLRQEVLTLIDLMLKALYANVERAVSKLSTNKRQMCHKLESNLRRTFKVFMRIIT